MTGPDILKSAVNNRKVRQMGNEGGEDDMYSTMIKIEAKKEKLAKKRAKQRVQESTLKLDQAESKKNRKKLMRDLNEEDIARLEQMKKGDPKKYEEEVNNIMKK